MTRNDDFKDFDQDGKPGKAKAKPKLTTVFISSKQWRVIQE